MSRRVLLVGGPAVPGIAPRTRTAVVVAALSVLLVVSVASAAWMSINTNDGLVAGNLGTPLYTNPVNDPNLADYLQIKNAWAVNDGTGFYFRLEAYGQPAAGTETQTLRVGVGFDCNNDGDVADPYVSGPDGDRKVVYWVNSTADQVWIYSGTNQQIIQLPDNTYGERVGATYDWWVPIKYLPPACRASAATIRLGLATVKMVSGSPVTQDDTPLYPWNNPIDYGDANNPDPAVNPPTCTQYPTRIGCDGARHGTGSALILGATRDPDGGNGYDANATDDDQDNVADEDGVAPTAGVKWQAAGQGSLSATVSGGSGYLNCWVDWNNDQDWADAGEKIVSDAPLSAGASTSPFSIPNGITIANVSFIARCRLAPGAGQAAAVTGATEFGEVEDHKWSFDAAGFPVLPAAPAAASGLAIAPLDPSAVRLAWTNPPPNDKSHVLGSPAPTLRRARGPARSTSS